MQAVASNIKYFVFLATICFLPRHLHYSLQGPESWHPAPDALKQAAKQCADLAVNNKLSLPELAVKVAIQQAGSGVAVHLMGELGE